MRSHVRLICPKCSYADSKDSRIMDFLFTSTPMITAEELAQSTRQPSFLPITTLASDPQVWGLQKRGFISLELMVAPHLFLLGGGVSAWADDKKTPTMWVRFDGLRVRSGDEISGGWAERPRYLRQSVLDSPSEKNPCIECLSKMTGIRLETLTRNSPPFCRWQSPRHSNSRPIRIGLCTPRRSG